MTGVSSGPALEPHVAEGTLLESTSSPIQFPDVYGLGAAFRSPNGAVTASFEWDHVEYSTIVGSVNTEVSGDELALDDADELHVGFEYVFIQATPIIAARLGLWTDPDHQIRFVGDEDDGLARALLPAGADYVHYAVSVGMVLRRFQIDVGVDLSGPVDTTSLSAIYSF